MAKPLSVFLLTCLVALVVQGFFWRHFSYVDRDNWIDEARAIIDGRLTDTSRPFYGYPAMSFLTPVMLINKLGVPIANALSGVIAVQISLIIAGCALLGRLLRPAHWWWVGIAGLLIFNRLFFSAVPPTAIVSPLIVLLVLILIYIREQSVVDHSWLIVFGGLLGLALATRIEISSVVGFLLVLWLLPKLKWRIVWLLGSTLFVLVAFDFYLIIIPTQHLTAIYQKISTHYLLKSTDTTLLELWLTSPLAFISLLLASTTFWLPGIKFSIQRRELAILVVLTTIACLLIWPSSYKPRWYFYPFIFLWEIWLPLWLIELTETFTFTGQLKPWRHLLLRTMQLGVIGLLVTSQAVFFWHLYLLPEAIFVL